MSTTEVVVGRIGRPHGLTGELSVEVRTDEPDRRFQPGAALSATRQRSSAGTPATPRTLTVRSTRWHGSRLLVGFEEITDRAAAEAARGLVLWVHVPADELPDDPDEFYDHQLVGLSVCTPDATVVGVVTEVRHGGGQDLLVVRREDGEEVLVPFVSALVPAVDLTSGRLEVADRPGLLWPEPDHTSHGL